MKIKKFIALLLALAIIFPQFSVFASAEDTVIPLLTGYSANLYTKAYDPSPDADNTPVKDNSKFSITSELYYVIHTGKIIPIKDNNNTYKNEKDTNVTVLDAQTPSISVVEGKEYKIQLPSPLVAYDDMSETIKYKGEVDASAYEGEIATISCNIGTFRMTKGEDCAYVTFKMSDVNISGDKGDLEEKDINLSWVVNAHISIKCNIDKNKAESMDTDNNGFIDIIMPDANLTIQVEEITPEPPIAPTLTKKVTKAMDNRGLASWEIVYTAPNQVYIENGNAVPVKLADTLPTGLDIVKDSIQVETKLKGQDQVQNDNSQIQTTDTGFTYAIADDVETIKIKYNTQLNDEEFAKALAGNNTTYNNIVKALDENDGQVLKSNANVNTNSIKIIVSKKASDVKYHAAEGGNKAYYTLDWEIDIDAHGKQLTELNLVDKLEGQAIIISPKIMDSEENFKKLDMKIEYAEGNPVAPIVYIEQKDLYLVYDIDPDTNLKIVKGFDLNLKNYLGTSTGKVDTTKKFKITYKTQVDESYLASLDPDKIEIEHFMNTVSANFKFGEMTGSVQSKQVEAVPEHTIDPLITITPASKDENDPNIALKWNVTINPPRNITGAKFNMTEILFEDTFTKIKSCPDSTKRNDYQSFGWNEEKRNEQIENIRKQIEQQFTKGSTESVDITLKENYILNVKLKNTGTKPITFSYYTYGTNPYIWGSNMNQNFSYSNEVMLVKEGTKIDGQAIITDITATASQNAGGGQALVTWPLKYYYVSEKKIDWEIWVNAKGSPLGDIKLTDILPEGVSYIEGSARISDKDKDYTEADFTQLSEQQSETENYVIHNSEEGKLDFYLNNVSSKRAIRFSTTIDYEKLGSKYDETVNLKNTVNLYIKLYEGLYPSECGNDWVNTQFASETAKIKNNVLQKTSNIENDTKVNYKVIINPLGLELLSDDKLHLYIEDKLDDGLAFDEESVRLYKAIVADQQKTSGDNHTYNPVNITNGEEITDKNLEFDSANNKMTLELPETNIAYVLEYTAYITRKNVTLNNNVKLVGSSVPEISNQDNANHSVRLASYSGATLRPPANLFYSVVVKKTDNNKPLEGATIGLYSEEYDESSLLGVGVSDENGNCIISVKKRLVDAYNTLYVKEITAPDGYLLNGGWFKFDKDYGNSDIAVATIPNTKAVDGQKGKLTVYRYDENTLEPLGGAEFALFSYIGDDKPKTGVTNMRGLLTFDGLTEGATYYLQETKAPEGYPIHDDYKTPKSTGIIEASKAIEIQVESGLSPTLTVIKQDSENQAPLSGAEFVLYSDVDCTVPFGQPVITNENGEAEFTDLNVNQKYWLKEIKAPEGYILDSKTIEVDFTTIQNNEIIITNQKDASIPQTKTLKIIKCDSEDTSKRLAGAEFALYSDVDCKIQVGTNVTTNSDGEAEFTGLNANQKYWLKETKAPEGYILDSKTIEVDFATIQNNEIIITNQKDASIPQLKTLKIIKCDSEDTSKRLAGAEFALYSDIDCKIQVGTNVTTNSDGEAEFTDLNANQKYWLKETKAPEGYILDSKTIEVDFTAIQNNEIIITNQKDTSIPQTKTLKIIKCDSEDTSKRLAGAEFALYSDADCKTQIGQTVITNENGEAEFTDLNANQKYWLKEIKAPEGYILDSKTIEVDFTTIKNDELIITNKKDSNVPPIDPDPPEGGGGSSGGGGGSSSSGGDEGQKPTEPDEDYVLEYECNGGTFYSDETYSPDELVRLGKVPYRAGYVFTGWYADEELTELITDVTMTENKTVYAGWEIYTPSEMLNTDDHFAYIIGYPDGEVKPTGNITRAEVATIFFRLLEPTVREQNLTNKGSFSDVVSGMWHNIAISTVESLGIVKGYEYGNFAPDKPITRAELAAIATRFDNTNVTLYDSYSDISGHWAEDSIKKATSLGWVKGYPDGTFKPDEPITRAEAMTLINNVLLRLPQYKSDLLDGMIVWPDNTPDLWYYLAVQEATNSHDYRIKDKGIFEIWTKINPVEEWVKYQEKPVQKPTEEDNQQNQDNDKYEQSDHLYGRFFF